MHECPLHGLSAKDPDLLPEANRPRRKPRWGSLARESDPQVVRQAFIDGAQHERLRLQRRAWTMRQAGADVGARGPYWCEAPGCEMVFMNIGSALDGLVMHHSHDRRDTGPGYRDRGLPGVDRPENLAMVCHRCHAILDPNLPDPPGGRL